MYDKYGCGKTHHELVEFTSNNLNSAILQFIKGKVANADMLIEINFIDTSFKFLNFFASSLMHAVSIILYQINLLFNFCTCNKG